MGRLTGWLRRNPPWLAVLLVGTLSATEGTAPAPRDLGNGLQVHGFASLTAVKTSDNRFFGDSPDTSPDFIEVALNASYRLNPRVMFAGQVLSRLAGEMYNGTPTLDYGLVDATLDATATRRLGVRLGRLKNPLGLYNATRDVPFTRPTIFLPQVIYFDKVRNMLLSTDGLMFYGDRYGDYGSLSVTLGGGQSVVDDNLEWVLLGDNLSGNLLSRGVSWVGSLWYATPGERWRLGLSVLRSSFNYQPGADPDLGAGQADATVSIASAQYNTERWTLSAEFSRLPLFWRDFGDAFPFRTSAGEAYYLQGAYRLRPDLELTLRYESGVNDRQDRDGTRASAALNGVGPPFDFYARTWTLGVRWDLGPHLMLRADYQRHQGTYTLSVRENDPAGLVPDWDLFALQIAVRF
ncbi:MAG TPA: hypothetical protein VES73_17565 [Lamprocystis sp. (in: g-proteobacteria)]|nr:hypothetical protein [Lamprocystis sp. (in: g-proteobacteria)]